MSSGGKSLGEAHTAHESDAWGRIGAPAEIRWGGRKFLKFARVFVAGLLRAGVGGAAGAPAQVDAARGWHGETDRQAALGAGLMRDGNGPRALETLVRYRGAVLAELFRSLGALQALQAEARAPVARAAVGGAALSSSARRPDRAAGDDATAGS
jgi:hypothetical protein